MRTRSWLAAAALLCVGLAAAVAVDARQAGDAASLRDQLRGRYDVLSLQDGVGLVPRNRDAGIRIIEVRNGIVSVDGQALTGGELRGKLGADTDLILRVTYLDAAQQRLLAGDAQGVAAPQPATPPQGDTAPQRRRSRGGEIVRITGDVNIGEDEVIAGDVVVIMGNATVNGEVEGELTVVGGNADLGPTAIVRRDVTVVGGTLTRAPGAVIEGDVENVAAGGPWRGAGFPGNIRETVFGRVGSLAVTLFRVGLLALLGMVIVAFGRRYVEGVADRAATDPLRSGLTGFLGQLLFLPVLLLTVIVLAVSIIGIPLLLLVPFAIMLVLIVGLVGFTGVAYYLGGASSTRLGWADRGPYVRVLLGVLVIASVTLLARAISVIGGGFFAFPIHILGYLVEYAAWTLGFGAEILRLYHARRRTAVPAVS
jgi:hypothetical protein